MSIYNQGGPSATSLNFIGFDDAPRNGLNPLVFDQVYIQYDQPSTAGRYIHPVAGFVPGQQPYLKRNVQYFNNPYFSRTLPTLGLRVM